MWNVIQIEWLLLIIIGALVLLVGCTNLPTRTPAVVTTTPYPQVTLTVVPFVTEAPIPKSTVPPSITHTRTLSPQQIGAIHGSPPTLRSHNPTCFSSPSNGFVCYGQIWNDGITVKEDIILRFRLRDDKQNIIASQRFALEQHQIPPHDFAPYRVQFNNIANRVVVPDVSIMRSSDGDNPLLDDIEIVGTRGAITDNGRYFVTTTLENTSRQPIHAWRLVTSILSDDNILVGYRILESEQIIQSGEQLTVRVDITPQIIADDLRHYVYVEVD